MSLGSKFRIESTGMLLALVFYAAVGILLFVMLPLSSFPPHLGVMGILSLVTAYGLLKKRSWAIYLVVILFFVGTTFTLSMLYYLFEANLLVSIIMILYLILTWVATIYVGSRRTVLS